MQKNKMKNKKITIITMLLIIAFAMTSFATGWVQSGTEWEYEENGNFLHNTWKEIDGINYHFNQNAKMDTGLCYADGHIRYFDNNGKPFDPGTEVKIMGQDCRIESKGAVYIGLTPLADKYTIDEIKIWEQEEAEKAKEQIELIRNQKKFENAMKNVAAFDEEQIALQNAKKENTAAVNTYTETQVSYGKIDITSKNNQTIQRKTDDDGKIKITVAVPTFSGSYSEQANQNAWKITNAIGEYLEYELGVEDGTYKFDKVEYVDNTDQYVTLKYTDATNGIVVKAEMYYTGGVDVTG